MSKANIAIITDKHEKFFETNKTITDYIKENNIDLKYYFSPHTDEIEEQFHKIQDENINPHLIVLYFNHKHHHVPSQDNINKASELICAYGFNVLDYKTHSYHKNKKKKDRDKKKFVSDEQNLVNKIQETLKKH